MSTGIRRIIAFQNSRDFVAFITTSRPSERGLLVVRRGDAARQSPSVIRRPYALAPRAMGTVIARAATMAVTGTSRISHPAVAAATTT